MLQKKLFSVLLLFLVLLLNCPDASLNPEGTPVVDPVSPTPSPAPSPTPSSVPQGPAEIYGHSIGNLRLDGDDLYVSAYASALHHFTYARIDLNIKDENQNVIGVYQFLEAFGEGDLSITTRLSLAPSERAESLPRSIFVDSLLMIQLEPESDVILSYLQKEFVIDGQLQVLPANR